MARYNKIYAGPWRESMPQVAEALATVETLPGCLVVWTAAGLLDLADGTTTGKVLVAQDNYLAMKGVDDAWAADSTMVAIELLDEQFVNVRVATGNDIARGDALTPAAAGLVAKAAGSDKVIGYAEETYNNDTGDSQLVRMRAGQGYVTAA